MVEPVLLRIQETAKLLKVSKWTIYRWIEEGRLRATKIGRGSLRVFQASVSGLVEEARIDYRNARNDSPKKAAPVRAKGMKENTVTKSRKRVR
jgi:excisionase family DNA binding protein